MDARTCADGLGASVKVGNRLGVGPVGMIVRGARTCADGVGAREKVEMDSEKDRWA